ncbi:MAG TPA: hydroxyisourate hydrolase [Actinomycetes bacterium]|nr:hydroxyisourate hydrolase [Actinomycetes bacterium]
MSVVTTHVLDTVRGRPAAGVPVRLEQLIVDGLPGHPLADAVTDEDGRLDELGPDRLDVGTYRLVFDTAAYFKATGQDRFFPEVSVVFAVADPATHVHVPLLLAPYAYSTYRGS